MEKSERLIAAVDFETFYDKKSNYTLKAMTPYEYVHDDRFDAYLVAVAYSDGRPTFVGNPKKYDWSLLDDAQLLAHNATFDGMVLRRLEELGIVEPKPRDWLDTADMVAFLGVTRTLKIACRELLGLDISKEVRDKMDGKTDRDLVGKDLQDLYDYGGSDAEECLQLFLKYGHKWPEIERRISTQNRNAAWFGINVDEAKVNEGIAFLSNVKDDAESKLPWVRAGQKAGSIHALAAAVSKLGLPTPPSFRKNDPRYLAWEKQYASSCPFIEARVVYAGTAPHIARLTNLRDHLREGLYHSDIRYFGTHTGRTASGSGGDRETESASKINLLNLTKQKIHGVVDMRGMFIPRPGHKFIIYDYGQIEARVVKWLAGDDSFVQQLRDEGNIYQAEAVKMQWVGPKGPSLKKSNKHLYQLAKAATLGLGYSMGVWKFVQSCRAQSTDLTPVPRSEWPRDLETDRRYRFILANQLMVTDIDDPKFERDIGEFLTAEKVVRDWRKANKKVVDYWESLNKALRSGAEACKDVFYFRLPSGRVKPYFRPRIKPEAKVVIDPDTMTKRTQIRSALTAALIKDKPAVYLHGGSLTENITQATARDIMAYAALDIETDYPWIRYMWSCYDEIIFEVPEDRAEEANKIVPYYMCHGPSISKWVDNKLPLEVEGGIFDRYCK